MNYEEALARTEQANRRLMNKLLVVTCVIGMSYFMCLLFPVASWNVAKFSAAYIPSVQKLLLEQSNVGQLAAGFFAVCWMLGPLLLGYLLWAEEPVARVTVGAHRSGNSPFAIMFFAYALFFPIICAVFVVLYMAPFEMPSEPHLWGQHLLALMLHTYVGLLILGAGLVVAMLLFLWVALGLLMYPFASFIHSFRT